ncbi:MAG: ribonuclease H-like domain-containing protein [Pseudomonadota bacterium]
MSITLHDQDLPETIDFGSSVAIDTEAMGLNPYRDRLCLVQMSAGDGTCHMVQFRGSNYHAPRLTRVLSDPTVEKVFHFARFDVGILKHYLGVTTQPLYCTKIASRLARTYTDRHGLKDLCHELLGIELSKEMQSSDWGVSELTEAQLRYAAHDVLHLHELRARLDAMLKREQRVELAQACFDFLPHRATLDLAGWPSVDIFAY